MRDVTIQRESFAEFIDEALPLMEEHWREVAHYKDIPLDVNIYGYNAIERAGLLRVFTVRVAGKLAGYAMFFLGTSPHYESGGLQALQDVIYIDPSIRGRFIGVRFVKFCDESMKADGVRVVYHHQKIAHPDLGVVLKRVGYEPVEVKWGRRLDVQQQANGLEDAPAVAIAGG